MIYATQLKKGMSMRLDLAEANKTDQDDQIVFKTRGTDSLFLYHLRINAEMVPEPLAITTETLLS